MFLNLFTAEQQIAFARIAVYLVHVDGVLDEREEVLLDELQQEMGLAELPPYPDEELIESDIGIFDDSVSRRIFLLELASIVTADEERHENELAALERWCDRLGEDPSALPRFLDLSDRAHAVYREARDLVFK